MRITVISVAMLADEESAPILEKALQKFIDKEKLDAIVESRNIHVTKEMLQCEPDAQEN